MKVSASSSSPVARSVWAIFSPSIKLMGRLSFFWKSVVTALLLAAPLSFVLIHYVRELDGLIEFSQKELDGVQLLNQAHGLLSQIALSHRRDPEAAGGESPTTQVAAPWLDQLQSTTDAMIASESHPHGSPEIVLSLRSLSDELRKSGLTLNATDSADAVDPRRALIEKVQSLIVVIGNVSNLILDPDLDTYYLMDHTVLKLPERLAILTELSIQLDGALSTSSQLNQIERDALLGAAELLRVNARKSRVGMQFAFDNNPEGNLGPSLGPRVQTDRTQTGLLLALVKSPTFEIGAESRRLGFVEPLEQCIQGALALHQDASRELDGLVRARILEFRSRRSFVIAFTALAIVIAGYLLGGSTLAITSTIDAMSRMTNAMVKGDFSDPLRVASRDELATVAELFNRLALRLHLSEQFNRATIDALSAQVAVLDGLGNVVTTNRAWRDFADEKESTWQAVAVGANYLAVCDAAAAGGDTDALAAARAIRQVIAGERDRWVQEYAYRSEHGQKWFYSSVTRFEAGREIHVAVAHDDVTTTRLAQDQLASSYAKYESLAYASPVGILLADADGRCVGANDRCLELCGMPHDDLLGEGWLLAVHPEDRNRVRGDWSVMVRRGERNSCDFRMLRPEGEIVWVRSQAVPIRDGRNEIVGFTRVTMDVSEQRITEQALRILSFDLAKIKGQPFYEMAMTRLAELVDCEMAALCEPDPDRPDCYRTIAFVEDGQVQPSLRFELAGTPCAKVAERESLAVPRSVRELYPDDSFLSEKRVESYAGVPIHDGKGTQRGHIAVMSRRPMNKPEHIAAVLKLFALSIVAERQRQMSERRFSDLFEYSTEAIVIIDANGIVVQANGQVATMFGWGCDTVVGLPVEALIPPERRRAHTSMRQEYQQAAVPRTMGGDRPNLRGLRADGSTFPVEVSLTPLESEQGRLVAAAVRDVTERNQAQERLSRSEAQYRELFESSRDAVVVLSPESGSFTSGNPAALYMFGVKDIAELCTLGPSNFSPDRQPDGRRSLEAAEALISLAMQEGTTYFEWTHRRKDGLEFPATVLLTRMLVDDKPMLQATVRDITNESRVLQELKDTARELQAANQAIGDERAQLFDRVEERTAELREANAELQRTSAAKSEFLAMMSHELRTPLNGILGMNELLGTTELDSRQAQYVGACNSSGRVLLQLINDILDLSKIEAGKLELDPRETDLESLVYDVVDIMSYGARDKGLTLNCRLALEACVMGRCDDNRLRQVLVNLIGNAIKFTPQGIVTVEVDWIAALVEQTAQLRFAVTDTGVGIPPERLDRLFKVFSQVDSSTTRRFGGTGLGLSICKQLVELMGGEIGVNSQVGIGTTFWCELPIETAGDNVRMERARTLLAGTRVVAADGLDHDRRQLGDCLRSWGCPLQQVATVAEALLATAAASKTDRPVRLVLADCRLVTGDELALLQELAGIPGVQIIGLGAPPDAISVDHLYGLGVRSVLTDPVRPSDLLDAIVAACWAPEVPAPPAQGQAGRLLTKFTGHVLVAEDNQINQLYIVELLKYFGCACEVVENGEQALAAVRRGGYDLALMDCQMPEMDGFSATREIRRLENAGESPGRLPIIALTANALQGDRERCLEAGMDDYVSKPIESDALRAILAKYLRETQDPPAAPDSRS